MYFLCLCYSEWGSFDRLDLDQLEEIGQVCARQMALLRATGKVRFYGEMEMADEDEDIEWDCTLRTGSGGITVEAGPYAKTGNRFGDFFIVLADSIGEAAEIARLHPALHSGHLCPGAVEIRPISQVN
jgi:hypothetical protein